MIVLGLTGGIGMGKSTVAEMFRSADVPVWDADLTVHNAYEYDEAIYKLILKNWPSVCKNARVDRAALGEIVFADPAALRLLERMFGHHLELARSQFIADARYLRTPQPALVVLDIPLLLENPHLVMQCHYVAVVTCSQEEQRRRVLERPGMTEERFAQVLAQQMPDAEKLKNADIRIDTGASMLDVQHTVSEIIEHIIDDDWMASHMFDADGLMVR